VSFVPFVAFHMKSCRALPIPSLMPRQAPSVLVVDDTVEARLRFTRWLSAEGFRCRTASRRSALRALRRGRPHVAVVSTRIDGDGLALVRAISAEQDGAAVVLVTDQPSMDGLRLARRAGASDCLVAPCTPDELTTAIARAARQADADARMRQETLETARLVRRRHDALCQAMAGATSAAAAIERLRTTFGARVPALFAHGRRVARVAVALCRDVGLSPSSTASVEDAALLHDIGKLSLPEDVLLGTATPGDAVVEALLDHHARARQMLARAPALEPVAGIIEAVHECWDGSGYPRGLAGASIPMGARIVAVADLLDAVQTWGVHQEPLSRADAQAALVREAGTRLDPDLVRACLQTMERPSCFC
jgi:putative two-component system response regulator